MDRKVIAGRKTFPGVCALGVFLALFSGAVVFPELSALEPGRGVPRLTAEKWYGKEDAIKAKRLSAIVLMDLSAQDSPALLQMLESMLLSAQGRELSITVFAMNQEKTADAVMKSLGSRSFPVGLDSKLRMRDLLAPEISLFPYAILAENGVVLWSGLPTELELVTEKVLKGTFSAEKQKKVEGLRKELQIAIQSGLAVVVSSTADRILAVLPDDRLAIQSKLFALNAMRKREEAEAFIAKVCKENPSDVRLRIMQLDFLLRAGKVQLFVKKVLEGYEQFRESKDLLLFVSFVIENVPFGVMDPAQQIRLAGEAFKRIPAGVSREERMSRALGAELLAKALSLAGRFEEAVKWQEEAFALRKGTALEEAASLRLAYYRAALAASRRKSSSGSAEEKK